MTTLLANEDMHAKTQAVLVDKHAFKKLFPSSNHTNISPSATIQKRQQNTQTIST